MQIDHESRLRMNQQKTANYPRTCQYFFHCTHYIIGNNCKHHQLSSLKTLVPKCCNVSTSNTNFWSLTSVARSIDWARTKWHACFDRWAWLRPVVQAVGLAENGLNVEEQDLGYWKNPHGEWCQAQGWANAQCRQSVAGWGAWNTHTKKRTSCIDISWSALHLNITCLIEVCKDGKHIQSPRGENCKALEPDQLCCIQRFLHRISRNQAWQLDYPLWKRRCQNVATYPLQTQTSEAWQVLQEASTELEQSGTLVLTVGHDSGLWFSPLLRQCLMPCPTVHHIYLIFCCPQRKNFGIALSWRTIWVVGISWYTRVPWGHLLYSFQRNCSHQQVSCNSIACTAGNEGISDCIVVSIEGCLDA